MTSTGAVVCHYGLFVIKIFSLLIQILLRLHKTTFTVTISPNGHIYLNLASGDALEVQLNLIPFLLLNHT